MKPVIKKWSKRIIWSTIIALALGISAWSASAADFTYEINYTQLPFNSTEFLSIQAEFNDTIELIYTDWIVGPDNFFFNQTNFTTLTLNISVPAETEPGFYDRSILVLTENLTIQANVSFLFNIVEDRPEVTEFIQIDINRYKYTYCDHTLPRNGTLENIVIGGINGQVINTSFDPAHFNLPNALFITEQGFQIIDIQFFLSNITAGGYSRQVDFKLTNSTSSIFFEFDIEDCIPPPPSYDEIVRQCAQSENLTQAQFLECTLGLAEYYADLYASGVEAAEPKIIVNETIQYVNRTERVPVLDLDDPIVAEAYARLPELVDRMDQWELDRSAIDDRIRQQNDDYAAEVKGFKTDLQNAIAPLSQQNQLAQNTINELEEGSWKKSPIIGWGIFILIVGSIIFVVHRHRENNPY